VLPGRQTAITTALSNPQFVKHTCFHVKLHDQPKIPPLLYPGSKFNQNPLWTVQIAGHGPSPLFVQFGHLEQRTHKSVNTALYIMLIEQILLCNVLLNRMGKFMGISRNFKEMLKMMAAYDQIDY
jgi:hypothetical protein